MRLNGDDEDDYEFTNEEYDFADDEYEEEPKKPKKEYVCTFHVRCTSFEQRERLKEFWKLLKEM